MTYPFMQDKKLTLKDILSVSLSLIAVIIIIRFKGIVTLSSLYLGGSTADAGLYVWLFEHSLENLLPLGWFNTNAFYPYANTLAWSDNFFLVSLAGYYLVKLGLSTILAYNLVILMTTFLNGFCATLLAYKLIGRRFPALISGILFMSYAYFSDNLGHPQLQFAFWLPLCLSCFFSYVSTKKFLWGFLLGLSITGAFLTTVYFAVFSCLLLCSVFFILILLHPQVLKFKDILRLAVSAVCGLLPLIPFIAPYLAVQETFGSRYLTEPYAFSENITAFLPYNVLSCGITALILLLVAALRLKVFQNKKLLYLTFSVVLLTILTSALLPFIKNNSSSLFRYRTLIRFAVVIFSWFSLFVLSFFIYQFGKFEKKHNCTYLSNRDIILIFLSAAYFFFILILGPLGNTDIFHKETAPSIFSLLFYVFPGLSSIRDISRLAIVITLCISIITAPAIMALFPQAAKKRHIFTLIIAALFIVENFRPVYPLGFEIKQPEIFKVVAEKTLPHDVVMVLPMTAKLNKVGNIASWRDYAVKNVNYMNMAATEKLKIVNGYSGMVTKLMRDYPRKMALFPDERSIKALQTISGLRFVLYNSGDEPHFNQAELTKKTEEYSDKIIFHGSFEDNWLLFELKPNIFVSDDFFLQVPSYPQGNLEIELKAETGPKDLTVELFALGRIEDKPFYTLKLPADNNRHKFTVPLPQTPDSVRPLRITFKPTEKTNLIIGNNYFIRRD